MVLGDVEETVTVEEVDEETYESVPKVGRSFIRSIVATFARLPSCDWLQRLGFGACHSSFL